MRKEKHMRHAKSTVKKSYKSLSLILALVLLVTGVVGGTIAWLISQTDPVVNTFTYGDIDITLDETELDENGEPVDKDEDGEPDRTTEGNDYEMLPGEEYLKDPVVTVLAGNEACWLFVQLEENGGVTIINEDGSTTTYEFDDYLTYDIAEGWTQLLDENGEAAEGVYFRYVGEDTDDTEAAYDVLEDNKIKVLETVTKDMLNALDNNGQDAETATYPTLSATAYAVQYSGFEAEISDGATESTPEQLNAAALKAWQAVEDQNAVVNP